MIMSNFMKTAIAVIVLAVVLVIGYRMMNPEDATVGETIDGMIEDTGDAASDAMDSMGEAADDAMDATEEAAEDTGEAAEEAYDDMTGEDDASGTTEEEAPVE
jgi:hypothetical protein